MLSKLKQFKDIGDQAKQLQSALSEESVTVNKNGLVLTMNGNLDLTGLAIDENLLTPTKKDKLESLIKELHKDALKKMQRTMAMKMKEMGGLPGIPGLS